MMARRLGIALALLTAATTAWAQDTSLNRPGSGARAAGMGNAFIAVSDDGTAASWNPAGLSQLRQPEFSLVHNSSWRDRRVEGYRTPDRTALYSTLNTPSGAANIEFVSAALPFDVAARPVTVQFGWRRVFQFSDRLQGDITRVPTGGTRTGARLRFDNSTSGSIHVWTAAAAIRLTGRLSAGVGVDFWGGGWENRGNMSEDPGVLGAPDFLMTRVANRIGGHSVNLGVLLAYPKVRIGAVYHGPLTSRYEVDQSIRSSLADAVDESFGLDGRTRLRFPRSIGVGMAWLPKPLLRFAADLTYDEWTRFLVEGTPASPDVPVSGFDGLPPELSASRNTVTVNAGMERLFPAGANYIPLRLGVSYEPQGGRDPYTRDNADHVIVAGGTGVNSNSVKVDIALEYRWGSFRSTQDVALVYMLDRAADFGLPAGPEAEGTTAIREWRLKLSLIYRLASAGRIWSVFKGAVSP